MTTPTFSTTSSSFAAVRYYTAADPYFYTVDNRPIGDLASNDTILSNSADAGRRAAMLALMYHATRAQSMFGTTRYVDGFTVTSPSANTLRVAPGSVYEYGAISTGDSRSIMKQAMSPFSQDFNINTVTLTGAQSVIYAIEAKFTDFSASTSGTYPLYDNANSQLHSSMLFGDLQLQIVAGTAATSGSEVAPAVTSGWFQLYLVTVNGATPTTYSLVKYPASPSFNSWGLGTTPLVLSNLTSTGTTVGDTPGIAFADGSTQGAFASLALPTTGLVAAYNPYKPVKFKVLFSPSVSSNNFAFRVKYSFLGSADAISPASYTTLTQDALAAGTANQLTSVSLTNGQVPGWGGLNKELLNLSFERVGADGADTNTGVLRVVSIQAYQ